MLVDIETPSCVSANKRDFPRSHTRKSVADDSAQLDSLLHAGSELFRVIDIGAPSRERVTHSGTRPTDPDVAGFEQVAVVVMRSSRELLSVEAEHDFRAIFSGIVEDILLGRGRHDDLLPLVDVELPAFRGASRALDAIDHAHQFRMRRGGGIATDSIIGLNDHADGELTVFAACRAILALFDNARVGIAGERDEWG